MIVRPYRETDAAAWDAWVESSANGTFLHSRRFMSYHGNRFADASLVIEQDGQLLGLLPAAVDPADARRIVSHPGLSFGAIVSDGTLRGARMIEALDLVIRHYRERGHDLLHYKAIPHFYQRRPAADDLYALHRIGAQRCRCDLAATIDLDQRGASSLRRRRSLGRAGRAAVAVQTGVAGLPRLWPVLEENLARQHGTKPTHSLDEIQRLSSLFPENIECMTGVLDGHVEAGLVLFENPPVLHCQYLASSEHGRAASALDLVIEAAIARGLDRGLRWFDFGISTEQAGQHLNEGLYEYKASYGAGGTLHEFYDIDLRRSTRA